jgi:hypothetical protein
MSYASMAALGQDLDFQTRVRACAYIECQQNLDNPDRADWSNLAYDTLRGAETVMDSFVRFVAQTPSIADTAGDPPDQSLITDTDLAAAVNDCYPIIASLWYNTDGTSWSGAIHPPVEPPEPEPPVVSSVDGVSPASGSKGTAITLTGTGLTGTTNVTIGGKNCTSLSVLDDTQVTAVTPAGSGGQQVPTGVYPVMVMVGSNVITGPNFEVV